MRLGVYPTPSMLCHTPLLYPTPLFSFPSTREEGAGYTTSPLANPLTLFSVIFGNVTHSPQSWNASALDPFVTGQYATLMRRLGTCSRGISVLSACAWTR